MRFRLHFSKALSSVKFLQVRNEFHKDLVIWFNVNIIYVYDVGQRGIYMYIYILAYNVYKYCIKYFLRLFFVLFQKSIRANNVTQILISNHIWVFLILLSLSFCVFTFSFLSSQILLHKFVNKQLLLWQVLRDTGFKCVAALNSRKKFYGAFTTFSSTRCLRSKSI